jgi:hypothetical protein
MTRTPFPHCPKFTPGFGYCWYSNKNHSCVPSLSSPTALLMDPQVQNTPHTKKLSLLRCARKDATEDSNQRHFASNIYHSAFYLS